METFAAIEGIRAAMARQDAAANALRATLTPEQHAHLEQLAEAAADERFESRMLLVNTLVDAFPGVAPALRYIADDLESRIHAWHHGRRRPWGKLGRRCSPPFAGGD